MRQVKALSAGAVMFLAAVLVGAPAARLAGSENIASDTVAEVPHAGASDGAFRHLQALQDIAVANGGNRAAGTPGYDSSAEYIAERLKEAGYLVRFEAFEFPFFEERTPPVLPAGYRPVRYVVLGRRDREIIPTWNRVGQPDEDGLRAEGAVIVYHWPANCTPADASVVVYRRP